MTFSTNSSPPYTSERSVKVYEKVVMLCHLLSSLKGITKSPCEASVPSRSLGI